MAVASFIYTGLAANDPRPLFDKSAALVEFSGFQGFSSGANQLGQILKSGHSSLEKPVI